MLKPPIDGAVITWLDATREGEHKSPLPTDGRSVTITEADIDAMVAFMSERTTPVPIDGGNVSGVHELGGNSAAAAGGWVLAAAKTKQKNGHHLWLAVGLLPEVAGQIGAQVLLYGSPIVAWGVGPDGKRGPAALHSYALTNMPFVQGLSPHRLGRSRPGEGVEDDEVQVLAARAASPVALFAAAVEHERKTMSEKKTEKEETKFDLAALRKMLGDVAKDLSDEQLLALVKDRLAAKQEEKPEEKPEPEKKPETPPPAPVAEAAAVKALEEKFAKLEADKKKSDLTAYLATKVAELGLVVEEKDRDEIVELAAAAKGKETIDTLLKLRPQPPKGRVMDKGGAGAGGKKFGSDDEAVEHFAASIRTENPKLSNYEITRRAILEAAKARPGFGGPPVEDALARGAREAKG